MKTEMIFSHHHSWLHWSSQFSPHINMKKKRRVRLISNSRETCATHQPSLHLHILIHIPHSQKHSTMLFRKSLSCVCCCVIFIHDAFFRVCVVLRERLETEREIWDWGAFQLIGASCVVWFCFLFFTKK